MKNRSFVRLWAPLVAALIFAAAFLAVHFVMNPVENNQAAAELNALLDMADARVEAQKESLKTFDSSADAAAIHKARTVERFIAHDDTLQQTDALAVLCALLDLKSIAVTDAEGSVIASSDAALIGTAVAEDAKASWSLDLLAEGEEPAAEEYGLYGRLAGMPRTDTDGLVLVWNEDAILKDAAAAADIRAAVENLAMEPDAVKLVETTGEDGIFEKDGTFYVQRSHDDVTLIAYRPLQRVHAVQNAVLTSLAIFAAASLLAIFIWQLTSGRGDAPLEELEEAEETPELPDDAELEIGEPLLQEPEPEAEDRKTTKRRRRRKPLIEISDEDEEEEAVELEPEFEKPVPKWRRHRKTEETPESDEEYDKIFE